MNIAAFILQAAAVLLTVMTFVVVQAQAAKARQQKINDAMRAQLESDISLLRTAVQMEEQKRVENINRLHARIDEMQKELISDLQGRMSRMEGDIQGMANILHLIHEWFINQAKGR